jgi:hypothetical protein
MAKRRVVYVSVHRASRIKLRMVKRIQRFGAEFERLGFGEFSNFVQSDSEIVDARPVEEVALGVSLNP